MPPRAALPTDTIYALATAAGRAGVAVFRVSGTAAREALTRLCPKHPLPAPRQAVLRALHHPATGDVIDHALVLSFPAPHSFTGEDVVELHTHGGRAVTQSVAEALGSLPHFRLAEAGEFTRRAFENGRMDLTEAEAIADLVHAETEAQRRQALRQMEGSLGNLYTGWRGKLARILAVMEAAIDFADEELPPDIAEQPLRDLRDLEKEIGAHLDDNHRGERLRDGLSIAILGAPNAGKSSLLNALARRDAAIVSSTAGTTRDVIEVHLDLGGYPVMIADTAGLRESADAIEKIGIGRALERAEQADMKLLVFDGTSWPVMDEATQRLMDDSAVVVVNKVDRIEGQKAPHDSSPPEGEDTKTWACDSKPLVFVGEGVSGGDHTPSPAKTKDLLRKSKFSLPPPPGGRNQPLFVSALTGEGLPELLAELTRKIAARFGVIGNAPSLTRARHREALEECRTYLQHALNAMQSELRAEDLRLAMRSLGRITGHVGVEDLLDIIFRDFCIGK